MKRLILSLTLLSLLFNSCGQKKDFTTLPSGLKYLIVEDKKEPKGKIGDYIKIKFVYANEKDSVLFSSSEKNKDGVEFPLGKPQYNGDAMEGFTMLGKGDSAIFMTMVDSFFKGRTIPLFLKAGTFLKMKVRCLSVKTAAEFEAQQKEGAAKQVTTDDAIIQKYIADNKIDAKKTASGLYYVIEKQGSGAAPKAGEMVTVNYTGKTVDGVSFDSNTDPQFNHVKPFEFPLGQHQVIAGWDEGIALFHVGGKGTLLIPSGLGYGVHGSGQKIPPNAVLIFQVELVGTKPASTSVQPQMQLK